MKDKKTDSYFELFGKMIITSHNIDDLNNEMGKQINRYGRILQDDPDEFLSERNTDIAYLMSAKILLMRKELNDMENIVSKIIGTNEDKEVTK